jgi:hypothetical protein
LSRENVGASTSHNPVGLHGLLQGQLYFGHVETQHHVLTETQTSIALQ